MRGKTAPTVLEALKTVAGRPAASRAAAGRKRPLAGFPGLRPPSRRGRPPAREP